MYILSFFLKIYNENLMSLIIVTIISLNINITVKFYKLIIILKNVR